MDGPRKDTPRLAVAGLILLIGLSACSPKSVQSSDRTSVDGRGGLVAPAVALMFVAMDTNDDKIVSGREADDGISREWQSLVALAQGPVKAIALSQWAQSTLGGPDALAGLLAYDRNGDGVVSEGEFVARLAASFQSLDRDGDGALTRQELVMIVRPPERPRTRGSGSMGGNRRPTRR